jgi:heterodisulfide reductase subunit A-like polyferredoxin
MLASSGFTAAVNNKLCEGCGTCRDHCQFSAIELMNKIAKVDRGACFGCGVCVDVCENNAISLNLDPERGVPLEIKKLIDEAQLAS